MNRSRPCRFAAIETGEVAFRTPRRRESKSSKSLGRCLARSASLSRHLVKLGAILTCLVHSLIVESISRSSMVATLSSLYNFTIDSIVIFRFLLHCATWQSHARLFKTDQSVSSLRRGPQAVSPREPDGGSGSAYSNPSSNQR